jgi:hypothetical protein
MNREKQNRTFISYIKWILLKPVHMFQAAGLLPAGRARLQPQSEPGPASPVDPPAPVLSRPPITGLRWPQSTPYYAIAEKKRFLRKPGKFKG